MHTVGKLLKTLCSDPLLVPHLLKQRSSCTSHFSSKPVFSPQTSQTSSPVVSNHYQLHYCPGYTPSQLMRMILEIYHGVPEGYAVLHCRPTTSAEELNLFIERMKHHRLPYLVLLVNQLPYKLQEVGTCTHKCTYTCTHVCTCTGRDIHTHASVPHTHTTHTQFFTSCKWPM